MLNVIRITTTSSSQDDDDNVADPPSSTSHEPQNASMTPATATNATSTTNKTKKFYESADSDTFIQAIFSQTITSTTVTPTDDDVSSVGYGTPATKSATPTLTLDESSMNEDEMDDDIDDIDDVDLEDDDDGGGGGVLMMGGPDRAAGGAADGHLLATAGGMSKATICVTPNNLSQMTETETFDGYQEAMISFSDVLGLEHDGDDGGGGLGGGGDGDDGDAVVDVWKRVGGGGEQGIVLQQREELKASYFDTTIEDDEDVDASHSREVEDMYDENQQHNAVDTDDDNDDNDDEVDDDGDEGMESGIEAHVSDFGCLTVCWLFLLKTNPIVTNFVTTQFSIINMRCRTFDN